MAVRGQLAGVSSLLARGSWGIGFRLLGMAADTFSWAVQLRLSNLRWGLGLYLEIKCIDGSECGIQGRSWGEDFIWRLVEYQWHLNPQTQRLERQAAQQFGAWIALAEDQRLFPSNYAQTCLEFQLQDIWRPLLASLDITLTCMQVCVPAHRHRHRLTHTHTRARANTYIKN